MTQGPDEISADDLMELEDAGFDALMSLPAHDDGAKARRLELVTRAHRPFPESDTCRFELDMNGHDRRLIILHPSVVMRPFAILFWGVGRGALVHQIQVRFEEQLTGAVPAHLFEADIGRDAFVGLVRPRPDGIGLVDTHRLGALFRFDMSSVTPADEIVFDVSGFVAHGVVIARTPSVAMPAPEPGVPIGAPPPRAP